MIRINCTECKAALTIDDAFAGGVCRCQHCGTIQTVPKQSSKSTRPAAPTPFPSPSVIASRPRTDGHSGSGLHAMAETLPSSSRLTGDGRPINRIDALGFDDAGSPAHAKRRQLRLLIGSGVAIALLTATVTWLLVHGPSPSAPAGSAGTGESTPAASVSTDASAKSGLSPSAITASEKHAVSGEIAIPTFGTAPVLVVPSAEVLAKAGDPQFYGVRVDAPLLSYVIDRNSSQTDPVFRDLCQAIYRSLDSLKPHQKFRVVFIGKKGEPVIFPQTGFATPTKENLSSFHKLADGIKLISDTDLQPQEAFGKAFAGPPAVILFATARSSYDERAAGSWIGQPGASKSVKVYGFNLLGANKTSRALKKLADSTHGLYRELGADELQAFAKGR